MEPRSEASIRFKRLVELGWRRKWWFAVPVVLSTVASLVAVRLVPKMYRATTTILVARDSVPENIVRSTVTLHVEERMRTMERQVFSRAYLEPVARTLGMIPEGADEAAIDAVCRKLRARIHPEIDNRDFSWFRISAEDTDPARAAGIANQIADRFIEQNSSIRTAQANGTLDTTADWEETYRLELAKGDEQLSEFKRQNLLALPEQQPANAQFAIDAQARITRLTSDIETRRERLDALQRGQKAPRTLPAGGAETRQAKLERELTELAGSYTEANPLVKRKRAELAELSGALPAVPQPPDAAADARSDPFSVEIAAAESEIRRLTHDREREHATLESYQARIRGAQQIQPRLLALTREHDQVKQQLDIAIAQHEKAHYSKDVEESKTGEQFQIQDRASPPDAPYAPDFAMFVLVGIGAGLALGAVATAAREFLDQTVRGEEEFVSHFPDLPIYGVIPRLEVTAASRAGRLA